MDGSDGGKWIDPTLGDLAFERVDDPLKGADRVLTDEYSKEC